MRLRVVWPGKTKDARLKALLDDYSDRLSHFVRCEIVELREESRDDRNGIDRESARRSDDLRPGSVKVVLDPAGVEWTSHELANHVRQWEGNGIKEVAFIVGGPRGVSEELSSRADKRWSLSKLTLTHEMARVVLMEQLYRAYTIVHNLPYQK